VKGLVFGPQFGATTMFRSLAKKLCHLVVIETKLKIQLSNLSSWSSSSITITQHLIPREESYKGAAISIQISSEDILLSSNLLVTALRQEGFDTFPVESVWYGHRGPL
jgi:hypothetical protein